jgi:5'-deoxynucleotidase YfbR-like HD superfamily hydrolase
VITYSGVNVTPENGNVPTLYDIGYALSRVPRFGGHCEDPWTVFQHSLACALYAKVLKFGNRIELLMLLHDSTESVISDIPHPWKTTDMRDREKVLFERILQSQSITLPTSAECVVMKEIDDELKDAEGLFLGPPDFRAKPPFAEATDVVEQIDRWFRGMNPHYAGKYFEELVNDYRRSVDRWAGTYKFEAIVSELSKGQGFNPQV